MSDAGKLKVTMEEKILIAINEFELVTGLTVEELRIAQRFESTSPIYVTSHCVLRNPKKEK